MERVKKFDLKALNHPFVMFAIMLFTFVVIMAAATVPASAYTLSNSYFNVQTGSYGEISSLQLAGDNYPTNYVMNASNSPDQNTSGHQWLGELMFQYRLGTGSWTKAYTNLSGDVRTQSQSGNTVTVTYQNSANSGGIKNFKVVETYSLVNDYLQWSINVSNTSSQTLEIGDFGLPLPFNERWPGNEEIYETRTVFHSFTGKNSSYIYVTRPSGIGSFLLMVPDASTGSGFEYQDHWRTQEHTSSTERNWCQDQGNWPNGLNVFYIHSNVIKSTNRGYLPNTSLTLAPGASKTYNFKFFKVANEAAMKDKLYSEGLIDVNVVPGMIFATNMTAKVELHTSKTINSISLPAGAAMTYLNTVATDHKIYSLTLTQLGPNNITINYGNGETTTLQFYATEPVGTALEKRTSHMVNSEQWNSPGSFYDKVFDDWMMNTRAKRNSFSGYWGWGDDWGLTHGEFIAEKNVFIPVASEIQAVDNYLETAIWNSLMKRHQSDYYIHDFLMYSPGDTSGECKDTLCGNNTPMGRGYAYPHVYNTYFSMYKIAKLYPNAITYKNPAKTYLYRAYRIMKTLYDGSVAYNWNTGLMGELTTPEIIQALKDEGYTTEANDLTSKMATKYNNFKNTKYPYGSEYTYDNTGEEAVYTLAKMNNNVNMMSKINAKTRACRGLQPIWYYYANPVTICGENWWNFQYTMALAGYGMDDFLRYNGTNREVDQRLSYAAKIALISCINSGQIDSNAANIGAAAWTYQAEKGNLYQGTADGGTLVNGWRQMTGEADLGLFGTLKILSSDVAVDPIFGLYGYGCDVTQSGVNYIITPKDGLYKRLNLITQKLYLELDRDKYTSATVSTNKDYIQLNLQNQYTSAAHTTKLSIFGLNAGSYDILVNNTKVGSFTATAGQKAIASFSVGTAAAYDIKIQSGTPTQQPEVIGYYKFDSNTTDSSGNGKNAAVNGTTSYVAGKSANAISLDGTSGYVSMPSGILDNVTSFTIAAWVNVNSLSDWARIFDFGTGTNTNMFLTPRAGGAGLRFAITNGGSGSEQQLNAPALATGTWKHVAVTLSGTTGILYVDGVEVNRNTSMTLNPSSLGTLTQNYMGKSQYSDPYLNGAIDEFKIYSRALSASEISALVGVSTDIVLQGTPSTSFCSSWESVNALNDGYDPVNSEDRSYLVYGNWDNPGTTQWVEYDFSQNYTISKCDVYWFSDITTGGAIDLPAAYSIQYWDGSTWVNVSDPVGLGVEADKYNTTTFTAVTTNKMRLNISSKSTASTGILEWKVWGH